MEVSESGSERTQPMDSLAAGSGAQLVDLLQSCPEQTLLLGSEFSGLGPDLANTTIIYVQADGSLVEGSGLTAEEQQALLEQLTQQQVVQVSDSEAAQLLHQSQLLRTTTTHNTALDPSQLQQVINQVTKSQQQVINQVTKSQQQVQVPQQNLKQVQVSQQNLKQVQVSQQNLKQVQVSQQNLKQVQVPQQNLKNASQQLKTAAQQVAMQTGGSVQVIQKKVSDGENPLTPERPDVRPPDTRPPDVRPPDTRPPDVRPPDIRPPDVRPSDPLLRPPYVRPPDVRPPEPDSLTPDPLTPSPSGSRSRFLPNRNEVWARPPARDCRLLIIRIAQILHLQPVIGQQGQQFFLQQGDAPIQLLLHSPAPVPGSLLPLVQAHRPDLLLHQSPLIPLIKTSKGPSTPQGPVKPVQSPVKLVQSPVKPVQSPRPPVRDKEQKEEEREQGSEGADSVRASLPTPKLQVHKTEDLADSHQSDSDDYSDLSEEEEGGPGLAPPHLQPQVPPHSCQTCDKAYIGAGGLNRHYRLNPTHGEPDPPGDTPRPLSDDSQSEETTAGRGEEEEEKEEEKPVAMTTSIVEGVQLQDSGACPPAGAPDAPRRGRGRGRPSAGTASKGGVAAGDPRSWPSPWQQQSSWQRGGGERLHEVVQQCGDQELVEALLPRLSEKIRDGGAATRFPDMYREFESLQAQVARSLGILDEVNRMKVLPGSSPSLTNKSVRYLENSKMLPPSKRFKMENRVQQQNGVTVRPPEEQIYLQTGGLTVQPGDRMVILNGPDGTTLQIQTPEGVPLDGVPLEGVPLEALLGIEAPQ
ncbi:hypothetical protein F7725_008797 [Dissostichus mawsoni]|uniref:C2H2-type domain-containing protein n=1 Tax=Dissostichus mawsoni TaxID=36200 RepID=A0A7J5Y861_DISMA|nr:hypothetical protein F7725_008797 [Dissostichus mawsoni]